jgi:hypothetical protein
MASRRDYITAAARWHRNGGMAAGYGPKHARVCGSRWGCARQRHCPGASRNTAGCRPSRVHGRSPPRLRLVVSADRPLHCNSSLAVGAPPGNVVCPTLHAHRHLPRPACCCSCLLIACVAPSAFPSRLPALVPAPSSFLALVPPPPPLVRFHYPPPWPPTHRNCSC